MVSGEGSSRRPSKKRASSSTFPFQDGSVLHFSSQEELVRFTENLANREIAPPRYITQELLQEKRYDTLLEALISAQLLNFCSHQMDFYNPILVRAFYSNLKYQDIDGGYIETTVNGKRITLILSQFAHIASLPYRGESLQGMYAEDNWMEEHEVEMLYTIGLHQPHFSSSGRPTITGMEEEFRVLFYIITRLLKPRGHSHTIIPKEDIKIMHAILTQIQFNWAKFVMLHMVSFINDGNNLPYAFLIMKILNQYGVDINKGDKVKSRKTWCIDENTFKTGEPRAIQRRPERARASLSSIAETLRGMTMAINRIEHKVDSYFNHVNFVPPPFNPQMGEEEELDEDDE